MNELIREIWVGKITVKERLIGVDRRRAVMQGTLCVTARTQERIRGGSGIILKLAWTAKGTA